MEQQLILAIIGGTRLIAREDRSKEKFVKLTDVPVRLYAGVKYEALDKFIDVGFVEEESREDGVITYRLHSRHASLKQHVDALNAQLTRVVGGGFESMTMAQMKTAKVQAGVLKRQIWDLTDKAVRQGVPT
jgi:hypothetical protein